ncbi:hypothetical protein JNB88_22605 [Rhizobium cauense]|uniref:hypothetical protein n=1 Tax=Rhizobium cauense TaxID=1166683 RepID=UPI001C6F5653|nr:hypothetical protein [Rhizobium cauense]MBW9116432.1 hypothetical protein [Rhizobium cauense]
MGHDPAKAFRYGVASLLMRRPHLRCHAKIAHWWSEEFVDYAVAIRARDRFSADSDDRLREYETLCYELEDELEGYLTGGEQH